MSASSSTSKIRSHRAGIFDIRNIIGALLGVYGVIILLMGLFADPEDDKTGGVGHLKVVRFWGFAPPDAPHGNILGDNADLARRLTKWPTKGSWAMGQSTPSEGRIENVSPTKVSKAEPDPVKTVPPKEAPQKKEQAVSQQLFVERSLQREHVRHASF